MATWDTAALSARFLSIAEDKHRYLDEIRPKIAGRPNYKRIYDDTLGEWFVHNRLHGRTWLNSAPELLGELRRMRDAPPPAGSDVHDPAQFKAAYVRTVDELLAEFAAG